jgi:hypothetical protein
MSRSEIDHGIPHSLASRVFIPNSPSDDGCRVTLVDDLGGGCLAKNVG